MQKTIPLSAFVVAAACILALCNGVPALAWWWLSGALAFVLACLLLLRQPAVVGGYLGGQLAALAVAAGQGMDGTARTASAVLAMQGLGALATLLTLASYQRAYIALRRDHRRLRAERDEQAHRLKEAVAVKSNFLAAASHDLRQPAQALALFVDELQRLQQPPAQHALVGRIRAASDNLIAALSALTDIAKLDGLGIEPRADVIDLRALVEMIFSTFQPMADAKGLQLSYSNADVRVVGDPSVLHGILSNLVSNAIKYTDRGSVRIHTLSHGTDIDVSVQDTGRGIAEKDRPHIYDEFFRGSNAGSSDSGMGLGLSIVRRLAHATHIPMRLESAIGVGSRFILTLPQSLAPAAPAAPRPAPPAPTDDRFLAGLHVVVLDNDLAVALSLQEVLQMWGARVHSVNAVDAMLQLVEAADPAVDVLIVDHHLGPTSDGFQAIEAIRALLTEDVHIPVLMMTGNLDPRISRLARLHEVVLVHKPIPPSRLKAILEELLDTADPDSSGFATTWQNTRANAAN